jgi:hypothetical protein
MRVIFPLMLIVFGILLVGFIFTNPDQPVSVTLAGQSYVTSLLLVIVASLTIGAFFVGLIALIEGWTIRLANHKARRRIQQLETENSFLRSEMRDSESEGDKPDLPTPTPLAERPVPSAAPVYDPSDPGLALDD